VPDFLNELASSAPAPGGGSAAALSGAVGCALMTMVAKLSIGKKGYEEFEDELIRARDRLLTLRERFLTLVDEDAESFKKVMQAYKLPRMTEAERRERTRGISEALKVAAETPFRTMRLALEVLELARPVVLYGNKSSVTDAGVGAMHLDAAFRGARLNVLVNLPSIVDEAFVAEKRAAVEDLAARVAALVREYESAVAERMGT